MSQTQRQDRLQEYRLSYLGQLYTSALLGIQRHWLIVSPDESRG